MPRGPKGERRPVKRACHRTVSWSAVDASMSARKSFTAVPSCILEPISRALSETSE